MSERIQMKTSVWTHLVLAGVAGALIAIPAVNCAGALADDSTTGSVVEPAPPVTSSDVADTAHSANANEQAPEPKRPSDPAVNTGPASTAPVNAGPARPETPPAVNAPRTHCVLRSAGTGWLLPNFDCR